MTLKSYKRDIFDRRKDGWTSDAVLEKSNEIVLSTGF